MLCIALEDVLKLSVSGVWFYIMFFISIMVVMAITVKIFFSSYFSKSFSLLTLLLLLMVVFSIGCFFAVDSFYIFTGLMHLSFYSMYLVVIGYGSGLEVLSILIFKLIADLFLLLSLGFILFLPSETSIKIFGVLYNLNNMIMVLVIISFLVYSLLGMFGFWIYWAMDASYFISCYLHSCGFMSVGVILFNKFYYFGIFDKFHILVYMVGIISFMSFFMFVIFFLFVGDMKKSFGFFSGSSITYLFLFSIISPTVSVFYFLISSIMKVMFFEVLSYILKFNSGKNGVLIFIILFLTMNLIGYSTVLHMIGGGCSWSIELNILIYVMGVKMFCVFMFTISVLNWFSIFYTFSFFLMFLMLMIQMSFLIYLYFFNKMDYHFWILFYNGIFSLTFIFSGVVFDSVSIVELSYSNFVKKFHFSVTAGLSILFNFFFNFKLYFVLMNSTLSKIFINNFQETGESNSMFLFLLFYFFILFFIILLII